MEENQPREQAGFRSGFSTTDHLQVLNQLVEKCSEYQQKLYLGFVDFTKAFDTIEHTMIFKSLNEQDIHAKYIRIIRNLYHNNTATIKLERIGRPFQLMRGVRQGDPLSPALFAAVLEGCFKRLNWDNMGINIDGEKLHNIKFADDITLIGTSDTELKTMLENLRQECSKVGLQINKENTKLMTNAQPTGWLVG